MVGSKRVWAPRSRSVTPAKRKKAKTSVPRGISRRTGTGNDVYCRFIYSQEVALNPGAVGTNANQQFRLSSIFDPDFTGVGHQPVNHDQYALIYERYQVTSVKYILYMQPNNAIVCIGGIFISDAISTSTDPREYIENGQCNWRYLASGEGVGPVKITGQVALATVHGINYQQYMSNDDYGANFGASPVENAFLTVFAAGVGSADAGTVGGWIELEYRCKLMGSRVNALS